MIHLNKASNSTTHLSIRTNPLFIVIITAILLITITGCEDGSTGTDQSTGKIVGFVRAYNQWASFIKADKVTVSLEGTDHVTVTEPLEGSPLWRYEFKGVEGNVYDIVFKRKGFGTMKILSYNFVGGGRGVVDEILRIAEVPSYSAKLDSVTIHYRPIAKLYYVWPEGDISKPVPSSKKEFTFAKVIAFYGTTPDVSSDNYRYFSFALVRPGTTQFLPSLRITHFPPGEKVYVKVYPSPGLGPLELSYMNPATGKPIFPTLGEPSKTMSVRIPDYTSSLKSNKDIMGIIHIGSKTITIPQNLTQEKLNKIQKRAHKLRKVVF